MRNHLALAAVTEIKDLARKGRAKNQLCATPPRSFHPDHPTPTVNHFCCSVKLEPLAKISYRLLLPRCQYTAEGEALNVCDPPTWLNGCQPP